MNNDKKPIRYGNSHYWAFFEELHNKPEIAIWATAADGNPNIIARVANKYNAQHIVDALISYKPGINNKFGKKEIAFLDFVKENCQEPYATMANNAIIWNDDETYNKLRDEFPMIYS